MAQHLWMSAGIRMTARALGAAAAGLAATANGQSVFLPLGVPSNASGSAGWLISADGSTAAGTYPNGRTWWRRLGPGPETTHEFTTGPSLPAGISADGRFIVGRSGNFDGFRFDTAAGAFVLLSMLYGGETFRPTAVAVSAIPVVGATGQIFERPALLGQSPPLFMIPPLTTTDVFGQATAATADGGVVVGYFTALDTQAGFAFRWTAGTGTVSLGYLDPPSATRFSRATAISADGLTVVGIASPGSGSRGFVWTAEAGISALGAPPGGGSVYPNGISGDGSVVVGDAYSESNGQSRAVIWDAARTTRDLREVLLAQGFAGPLQSWTLLTAKGITADGRVIVGTGIDELGRQQAYVASLLASPCYANCDGSTIAPMLNVSDFTCFLNRYAAGDSYANCDASTTPPILNVNDFICFQSRYVAGCP